ncbi:hypothetical protein LTR08_008027 [Meristemomyces frigidus]|nr:hypothetical protein LTR08_008027 [Meristemomyces frigidus]
MASGASKLIPADPEKVMVIRRLAPDILTCSTPFLRFGRIKIGGRGTVVRLQSGNLAVFSPVALTESVQREIASFGNGDVRYITALDQEHHIFLESWHKAFPRALVIGPEPLPELRQKQGYYAIPQECWKLYPQLNKTAFSVSDEFDREFDMEYVHSHANKELVFNHRPSRTLIQADLLFNLPATEQFSRTGLNATSGVLTKLFCGLNNTKGNAIWQRRFIWYAISSGDRPGYSDSVRKIAKWDFDRIIPCHGDVIEKGGKGVFETVMQWHLNGGKKGQ